MTQPRDNAPQSSVNGSDNPEESTINYVDGISQDLIGQHIGNYELTGWLGKGAAADVYRAIEKPLERQVAFKIMAKSSDNQLDPNFASRFLLEARAIAGLHHSNIITIYQYGEWRQRPYLVTELMEGGSLKELLEGNKKLGLTETISIIAQVGAALEAAHSHNIIHRDIKPSNVLLDGRGRAVLADFGIAKVLNTSDNLTMAGMSIGTPEYMSPEQAMGQPVDRRSDIYSLGVLAYRMLTGHCPFENESALAVLIAHSRETPPPLRSFNPDIPIQVERVVLKTLAKQPNERYQTAAQFVNALQEVAGSGPQVSPQPMPPLQQISNNAVDLGAATTANRDGPPPVNLTEEDDSLASPLYDEPTAFNPVVPNRQRQSYVQPQSSIKPEYIPAQVQPPRPDYDYNQQYLAAEPQPTQNYYTPGQGYRINEPTRTKKQRKRRRRGLGILAFIIGVLLAAGIFVGVWYYFLQAKNTVNVSGTNPGATATPNKANPSILENSTLVFASTRNGKWGIYTANYKGENLKKVVDNNTDDISPALSPDGKTLVYVSAPGSTNWGIHKVNIDGSNDVTLTSGNFKDLYPAWSKDGSRIAFIRVGPIPNAENGSLFVMNADGKNQTQVNNDTVGYVSWKPNDLMIYSYAKGGSHALRTLDLNTKQTKDLDALGTGEFDLPAWSPDGKHIAFVKGVGDARAIYIANADGTGSTLVSPAGVTASYPAWSPDGTRLAYLQKVGTEGGAPKWEVTESGTNGDNHQTLFNDGQQKFYLSWSK